MIDQIHKDKELQNGILIESGAGVPTSSLLFYISGASNTISEVRSLYSRKALNNFLKMECSSRAVSRQTVSKIIDRAVVKFPNAGFYFVSSFQVPNEEEKSKHGWIGLKTKHSERYYHLCVPPQLNRGLAINSVGMEGVKILKSKNQQAITESFINFVEDKAGNTLYNQSLEMFILTDKNIACVIDGDKIYRYEEILRDATQGLSIYRGSFNPWHKGHSFALDQAPPGTEKLVCISPHVYGKSKLTIQDLKKRISDIQDNVKDARILLHSRPGFKALNSLIYPKYNSKIHYIMGDDTLKRVISTGDADLLQLSDVESICLERSGFKSNKKLNVTYIDSPYKNLSSTLIRTKNKQNQWEL